MSHKRLWWAPQWGQAPGSLAGQARSQALALSVTLTRSTPRLQPRSPARCCRCTCTRTRQTRRAGVQRRLMRRAQGTGLRRLAHPQEPPRSLQRVRGLRLRRRVAWMDPLGKLQAGACLVQPSAAP